MAAAYEGNLQNLVSRPYPPPGLTGFEGFVLRMGCQACTLAPRAFTLLSLHGLAACHPGRHAVTLEPRNGQ